MKQFLVLTAILPLMLVFFVQFSMDQINSTRIGLLSDMVYAAKEEAKQEGCFTPAIRKELTDNIVSAFHIARQDVKIEATDTVKYRIMDAGSYGEADWERGLIYYKVSVPIGQLMAGRKLFGIRESDNMYYYTIESYTASEKLP
ncbi:MAG: hypothetical protein K5981_00765 [Clostridia bacterium]|nr:hypothetical protein [Clostridia bacterium]